MDSKTTHRSSPMSYGVTPKLYSIALHAGTMENWTYNPDLQTETEALLRDVSEAAKMMLSDGARAVDVVQFVVTKLENHEGFNAGKGSAVNEAGEHELEAAIVDGQTGAYGAIACAKNVKNPISAAHLVLKSGSFCFLVGDAADNFARNARLEMVDNGYFTTAKRLEHLKLWKAGQLLQAENLGTVGAIALDIYGNLSAAGSTGGNTCKPLGRVGDTAVIGAGLIADKNVAVVCGHGEVILKMNVAAMVSHHVAAKMPLEKAVGLALQRVATQSDGMSCAILAMDSCGKVFSQSTGRIFTTAASSSHAPTQAHMLQTEVAILEQHEFYEDGNLRAGLTRYPSMPGQVTLELRNNKEFSNLDLHELTDSFKKIHKIAQAIKHVAESTECGLITDGRSKATLVSYSFLEARHQASEGQNGINEMRSLLVNQVPKANFDIQALDKIYSLIKETSSLGDGSVDLGANTPIGNGLFSWMIWEDNHYAAFLSPSGSVLGECILRSRVPSEDDIFSTTFEDSKLQYLVHAIYAVTRILKSALNTTHCGILVDKCAIGWGNVSIVPEMPLDPSIPISVPSPTVFCATYPGYLTTQLGSLTKETKELIEQASMLRSCFKPPILSPPRSWVTPATHSLKALHDPWYKAMFVLQDAFYHACVQYFQTEMSYDYVLSPVTSDCISSPMGLGSDSLPIQISLHGRDTYLADSMQFTLEYMLRVKDGSKGMYYISPSFRGEDPDSSHLNQFYHVECELRGNLDQGMEVMERFVVSVAGALMREHSSLIRSIAGDTKHITNVLEFAKPPGNRFPRVTLDEAIGICREDAEAWEYVVEKAPEKGKKLTRKGERAVMAQHGGAVWLTMMEHLSVPFYQAYSDETKTKARCGDLLMGIGEMGGLGERHRTAKDVENALLYHEIPLLQYKWYMDIREYSEMQTVGWGMGMERFMLWLLRHDDVRDISLIPRLKTGKYLP